MADHEQKKESSVVNEQQRNGYSEEYAVRCAKVKTLREQGIEPWPANKEIDANIAMLIAEYDPELKKEQYIVAGVIRSIRNHGKITFVTIEDSTGSMQLVIKESQVGSSEYLNLSLRSGYIIWCTGLLTKTETEEVVFDVKTLQGGNLISWLQTRLEARPDPYTYKISGRLMSIREHGKSIFANLQDQTGTIQLYLKEDKVGSEQFSFFKSLIDIGDIVWVAGPTFHTKKGELTVDVQKFCLLSKCLHPLPEKFHGLVDVELKQRQRYLDLITSKESKARFIMRSTIVQTVREELLQYDFLEVETPMLHAIPGGAAAKPFVTHHNALNMDLFLRIAPELFLKRLIIGGFERVFEINRCFRNEGISTKHNPEFTSVEYYEAYQDYISMMTLTESIIQAAVKKIHNGTMIIPYQSYMLDFEKPFVRISMLDAVAQAVNKTVEFIEKDSLQELCKQHNVYLSTEQQTWGFRLYALFEKLVEPNLIQPTFVTHFPVEVSPLAKRNPLNLLLVDRFELFIAHMELSNGFSELNDPADQAERFAQQAQQRVGGDEEAHYYDADFVHALEYAMPPTVGAGIGIDRLVMLLTNTPSIRDIILFPTHKHVAK